MKTYQFLWRLIRFQPWFFALNCLCVTLVIVLEMVPGLIARQVFDGLAAHTRVDAIFWQLAILLLLSGVARVMFLFQHRQPGHRADTPARSTVDEYRKLYSRRLRPLRLLPELDYGVRHSAWHYAHAL